MTIPEEEVISTNRYLFEWVYSVASLTRPNRIYWCDGSDEEYESLINEMVSNGILIKLNQDKFPGCYLHRSNPNDVARTEEATFICTRNKDDAGPTNNWMPVDKAKEILNNILKDSMRGRTMYVVPYVLGPLKSPYSRIGIQITDSPYIVANLRLLTRMGRKALQKLGNSRDFVKGIHSMCNLDPRNRFICHFPEEKLIISVNSNYGGNAILSKKCHALRIASYEARNEGWLAEHMLIVSIVDPEGRMYHIAGAFPSASGKTNLAMLKPRGYFENWKVFTLSDDIAWLHTDKEGRLRAINPETGFFAVAVGTNYNTNPNMMETIKKNTIFTNVAMTEDGEPWWEGLEEPKKLVYDWRGEVWNKKGPAAYPNSRFTVSAYQYPYLSPLFDDPEGVPISAILFGGRRRKTVPLVLEAFDIVHGVLMGAMLRAETTVAASGKVGILRNDPMAMLPFCGYNMADYFTHFLDVMKRLRYPPRFFLVNWFRTGSDGSYLWPGFKDNMYVLKWILERVEGKARAIETPVGYVPDLESFDLTGLEIPRKNLEELFRIDKQEWLQEFNEVEKFFELFGNRFPSELWEKFYEIKSRLA
ncbi:MAG TPA: phosphoenolpyruvate carboxykinase (GTP) [Geobacterales bacterium]|nr:phosphoenolpyruvate carboxykinase (GTP) [Geobacterales bacterium]